MSQHPQIRHEWTIDDDEAHCVPKIPEENDSGFPITVEVTSDQIMVMASGAHTSMQLGDEPDELVASALGLVRDLLSPGMRIRERMSGGKRYKWAFERYENGRWVTEEWICLFIWNYFAKRTEKTYQNAILPARDPMMCQ